MATGFPVAEPAVTLFHSKYGMGYYRIRMILIAPIITVQMSQSATEFKMLCKIR